MKDNNLIKKYLGHYVTSQINDNDDAFLKLHYIQKNLSILIVDVISLSPTSENPSIEDMNSLQREYFEATIPLIQSHSGEITSILGDRVISVFGLTDESNHESKAVESGLEIVENLSSLKYNPKIRGIADLRSGIGISSGFIQIGNFGSSERFNFGISGAQVNLAAMLPSLCRTYETQILISASTCKNLDEKFDTRKIDSVNVKGYDEKLDLFTI